MIVVFKNIRYMRIFVGGNSAGASIVKRQLCMACDRHF